MAGMLIPAIFIAFCLITCVSSREETPADIEIQYVEDRPVAVIIPSSFFEVPDIQPDEVSVKLSLAEKDILGDLFIEPNYVRFKPAIPFKGDLTYEVRYRGELIRQFTIPERTETSIPRLINIYPTGDTVPENLLKIHLEFSEKMSELHSSNYVHLLNSEGDTLDHIFLKLDPELWNYDQKILTLWLEPGRIKKSLLPNVLDGIPISEGNIYTIAIGDQWKSAKGIPLAMPVSKKFYVSTRDEVMPSIEQWELEIPQSSLDPLIISFGEVLDYTSVIGSFSITGPGGNPVTGDYQVKNGETGIIFVPEHEWVAGEYIIHIDGSIEDLAANNLNRLFDRDLEVDSSEIVEEDRFLKFEIKEDQI